MSNPYDDLLDAAPQPPTATPAATVPPPAAPVAAPRGKPAANPYLDLIPDHTGQAALTVGLSSDRNASAAAADMALAKKYNTTPQVVAAFPADFRQRAQMELARDALAKAPALSRAIVNNPALAAAAHPEVPQLSLVNQAVDALGKAARYVTGADSGRSAGQDLLAIGGAASRAVSPMFEKVFMAAGGLASLADSTDKNGARSPNILSDAAFKAVDFFKEAGKAGAPGADAGLWDKALDMAGQTGGVVMEALATGGEAPAARAGASLWSALGGMASQGVRSMMVPATLASDKTFADVIEKGGTTAEATKAASAAYLTTTLAGVLPMSTPGKLSFRLGAGALSGLTQGDVNRQIMNAALPDSMQQPEPTTDDRILEALAGVVFGGLAGPRDAAAVQRHATEVARRTYVDAAQVEHAKQGADAVAKISELATNSDLRKNAPDAFKQLVRDMTDGAGTPELYVDAKQLAQAMDTAGIDAAFMQENMPVVASQMREGLQSEGMVRIPIEDYATHLAGTPADAALQQHLRVDPEGKTFGEAQKAQTADTAKFQAEAEKVLTKHEKDSAFRASAQEVHDDILGQLKTVNRFPADVNKAYAAMTRDFYTTLADRMGVTPKEALDRYPLQVRSEALPGGGAAFDQGAPKGLTIEGYHFSKQARPNLDSYHFGSGLQGSGREMFKEAGDKRLTRRLSFYADKGTGINPEAGVGGYAHRVSLEGVYDANADPLRLRRGGQLAFESAVLDHGYKGYIDRLAGTQSAQVIMLGDHSFRPEQLGAQTRISTGTTRVPAPEMTPALGRDVAVEALNANKLLPPGSVTLERWGEILAQRAPAEFAALKEAGVFDGKQSDQFYKSELIKKYQDVTPAPDYAAASAEGAGLPGRSGVRGGDGLLAGEGRSGAGAGREADGSLRGLPREVGGFKASAAPEVQRVAADYMKKAGLKYDPPTEYAKVDPARAKRIAQAFEEMKHDPQNPEVKAAYAKMAAEVGDQFQAALDAGLKVEFVQGEDPYAGNPRAMTEDVRNNNHMWVFSTRDGFGTDAKFDPVDNPLLAETSFEISGQKALANDLFRVVHDYFGHVKEGVGFRAAGEENAWQAHMAMFSPEARRAATTETRGQNSWLNYGPYGETNRTAKVEDTHFADQKVGLLPEWVTTEGYLGDQGAAYAQSAKFSEDNRLSNLRMDGPSWQRIRENNPALKNTRSAEDEVTIYRATVGDTIRPDDYVAVSKATLKAELANVKARDKSAKILEMRVKVGDLLMGNDATEFVYFPKEDGGTYPQAKRGEFGGAKVTFEVAPDPHDTATKAKWDALTPEARQEASHKIAWQTAAQAMAHLKVTGELHQQMGGYGADTNPSLSIWLNKNTSASKALDLGTLLGYALNQDAMMVTSPKAFKGGDEWGTVAVHGVTPETAAKVYDELRTKVLGPDGEPLIQGHTTGGDTMVILAPKDSAEAIAKQAAEALGDRHDVSSDALHVAWPEKGENDYGLSGQKTTVRSGSEAPLRAVADRLRGEAAAELARVLEGAGAAHDPGHASYAQGLKQTDTSEFKKWFGGSKVVDARGEPLRMFHGTSADLAAFDTPGGGALGFGMYFTEDPAAAGKFADRSAKQRGGEQRVMPVYLKAEHTLDLDKPLPAGVKDKLLAAIPHDEATLREAGYPEALLADKATLGYVVDDLAKVRGVLEKLNRLDVQSLTNALGVDLAETPGIFRKIVESSGFDSLAKTSRNLLDAPPYREMLVFAPEQVKSATGNRGAFDAQDPSILNQEARGQIQFGKDVSQQPSIITLFKGADLTTFLHESGHFFLEVYSDVASRADAPPMIAKDMGVLLDWFGMPAEGEPLATWRAMPTDAKREFHEKFARGFEAYLMEGKAPTPGLQGLFSRFASWLVQAYKSVAGLNVELTPEVRGVMDRMLASEETIRQAEDASGLLPLFTEKPPGMDAEAYARYQALGQSATDGAVADLQHRGARDMKWLSGAQSEALKAEQAKADAARAAIRDEVTLEVDAHPAFQAKAFMDDKANKGADPDFVADQFGYSSGEEMAQAISDVGSRADAIAAMTDQRMLAEHGDLVDERAVAKAASAAIHSDVRLRFLATELRTLAQATGSARATAQAAKQAAEASVSAKMVRDLRPGQYEAAEARAGKASAEAFKAGDMQTAAVQKRAQVLSHALAKAAGEAQAEAEKTVKYLKKFDKEGVRKALPADYLVQIDALLEKHDLRQTSMKAADEVRSLRTWVQSRLNAGEIPPLSENLLSPKERKAYQDQISIRDENGNLVFADPEEQIKPLADAIENGARTSHIDLTVEALRGLRDTVRTIEHMGRQAGKILTAEENATYQGVRDEIVASLEQHAKRSGLGDRTSNTRTGEAAQGVKQFMVSHLRPATWAQIMDGGESNGALWKYLIKPANERMAHETTRKAQATEALAEVLSPILKNVTLRDKAGSGKYFKELGTSLNWQERFAFLLNYGNESNLQRLKDGGIAGVSKALTDAQIQTVLRTMTAAELRAAQAVWDHLETYRPEIGALERKMTGKEPEWIQPRPFSVRSVDGELVHLEGGYYPVVFDPRGSLQAQQHAQAQEAKTLSRAAYSAATTSRSFTKQRVDEVVGRPLMLNLSGLYRGVNDVIHDLSFREWTVDANKLLRSKTIDASIRDHYGPEVKRTMEKWRDDLVAGTRNLDHGVEQASAFARRHVSIAGLSFNVMSAAIQPLGIAQSMARIGVKWTAKGIAEYVARRGELTQEVHAQSEFMRNRGSTAFRELAELGAQVKGQTKWGTFRDHYAFWLTAASQGLVDVPTWKGAHMKALAEGFDDATAVSLADQAVKDSQGGGERVDLSGIERGPAITKLFTVFYSFMNTAMNTGALATVHASGKADLAIKLALTAVIPTVLGKVFRDAATPGDSGNYDDWEKTAKTLISEQAQFMLGMVTFAREFSGVTRTLTGDKDMGYSGPIGLRMIPDAGKLAKQAMQGEFDTAFRKALLNFMGDVFGIPSAQINKTWTGMEALANGDTENPMALIAGYQKPN